MKNRLTGLSKKYGAGILGAVRWGMTDKAVNETLSSYGLASSKIRNAVPTLLKKFFPNGLTEEQKLIASYALIWLLAFRWARKMGLD
jgi:hypothetical protein